MRDYSIDAPTQGPTCDSAMGLRSNNLTSSRDSKPGKGLSRHK